MTIAVNITHCSRKLPYEQHSKNFRRFGYSCNWVNCFLIYIKVIKWDVFIMKKVLQYLIIPLCISCSVFAAAWQTEEFRLAVNDFGQVIELFDKLHSVNFVAKGQPSPLLQARIESRFQPPDSMIWDSNSGRITVKYGKAKIVVAVQTKKTHVILKCSVRHHPALSTVCSGDRLLRISTRPLAK